MHFIDEIEKDKENEFFQIRRGQYLRKHKLCLTLTYNMGTGGHNIPLIKSNGIIRKLTPKKCFNLMGFPNNYKLLSLSNSKLYCQAGNSVIVPLFEKLFQLLG